MSEQSVFIATPMYGGMCTGRYVRGLLSTIGALNQRNIPVHWAQVENDSLVTRARNDLVHAFMESAFTHLMFIDADISFDGHAVATLLDADLDIACGLYPKKEVNWASVETAARRGASQLADYAGSFVLNLHGESSTTNEHGFAEARHGGTGFMCIKRHVFERMAERVPVYRKSTYRDAEGNYVAPLTHEFFTTSIAPDGALLSEDYHFCETWLDMGGKVHVNPFIKLEHVGTYVFGGDIIKSGGNLK